MQLILNRNRTATEASTAAHWLVKSLVKSLPWPASHAGHPHWPCAGPSLFGVTTGAASSPSSADSWSIGFREPRPMSARMQSGLSDLGRARWDGQGERDEISIQNRAFFNLYILTPAQSVILFSLSSFSVSQDRCFSKDMRFFPTLSLSLFFPFLLHDLLSSGKNLSSGKPGSVSASAFLHSVPVYLSMWVNTLSTPLIPSIIGSVRQRPQCLPGCWQLAEIDSVMLYVRQSDLMTRL